MSLSLQSAERKFQFLLRPARYKFLYGGPARRCKKSWNIAGALIERIELKSRAGREQIFSVSG
jgi:hypothetical protein